MVEGENCSDGRGGMQTRVSVAKEEEEGAG